MILIMLISFSANTQKWTNVKGKPKNLKESFEYLDKMFDDTTIHT